MENYGELWNSAQDNPQYKDSECGVLDEVEESEWFKVKT